MLKDESNVGDLTHVVIEHTAVYDASNEAYLIIGKLNKGDQVILLDTQDVFYIVMCKHGLGSVYKFMLEAGR